MLNAQGHLRTEREREKRENTEGERELLDLTFRQTHEVTYLRTRERAGGGERERERNKYKEIQSHPPPHPPPPPPTHTDVHSPHT